MKHANVPIFVPHVGCPNRCSFCDQQSISGAQRVPDGAFVERTCREGLARLGARARNAEIAFFGGSFTAIDRALMVSLLEAAQPFLGTKGYAGIRLSTRPDAVDREILSLLRRYGVTAVELGAQSMDDQVLRLNRRGHTAADVERAARAVREAGFELGLQMMVGLYGDTEEKDWATARRLADLEPATMRIYPTVIIRNTMLAELYEQKRYRPITVPEAVRISAGLLEYLEGRGVRVIRVGLHASRTLERDLLAGGYHPAMRELCESQIFLRRMEAYLDQHPAMKGRVRITVPKGCASQAAGQHQSNRNALLRRGIAAKIMESPELSGYEFRMEEVEPCT